MTIYITILALWYSSVYYRIKTIRLRFKMMEAKEIDAKNPSMSAIFTLCLWFVPLYKYRKIENQLHNKYLKKCNLFLLLWIVSVFLYYYL